MAFLANASRAPTCDDWYEIYPCDWPLTAESNCTMTIAEALGTPYDAFSLFIGLTCAYLLGYWSLRFLEVAPALRRKLGLSGKNPPSTVLVAEAKMAKALRAPVKGASSTWIGWAVSPSHGRQSH